MAVSVLSFAMAELAPGDFFGDLQLQRGVSEETLSLLRERYGLDQSAPVRYAKWLGSIARGEFGFSLAYRTDAGSLLLPRAGNTLGLAVAALILAWTTAVPLGAWSARRPGSVLDRLSGIASSVLQSTPTLVLGLVFLLVAGRWSFFPTGGMVSLGHDEMVLGERLWDRLRHLILPATALGLRGFPAVYRHTRAAVAEVIRAPFLEAARGQGIGASRRLFRHALKAAANPLVSLFGLSVAGLLSGSLMIEILMSWPGLGKLLLESILARDTHVVIGAVLLSSMLLIAGNLLADLLLYWTDPRVRPKS